MPMTYEKIIQEDTFAAAVDLSGKQHTLVTLDANSALIPATASSTILFPLLDGGRALSPLVSTTTVHPSVVLNGVAKVKLGGTVAPGDDIGSDANGLGVKVTTGARVGKALYAGVSGDVIPVFVAIQ